VVHNPTNGTVTLSSGAIHRVLPSIDTGYSACGFSIPVNELAEFNTHDKKSVDGYTIEFQYTFDAFVRTLPVKRRRLLHWRDMNPVHVNYSLMISSS
jgi:hypothetical protein